MASMCLGINLHFVHVCSIWFLKSPVICPCNLNRLIFFLMEVTYEISFYIYCGSVSFFRGLIHGLSNQTYGTTTFHQLEVVYYIE